MTLLKEQIKDPKMSIEEAALWPRLETVNLWIYCLSLNVIVLVVRREPAGPAGHRECVGLKD